MPLFVPAIPFGLVLGLAITESGINEFLGWSSSPIIFGGAAQLILITLLGSGAAVAAAIGAALVVNARHVMYSAALAPTFQRQPRWFRWLGPFVLVDQMFALSSIHANDDPDDFRTFYLAAGATFFTAWNVTVALGLIIGPVVPQSWQLEFAIPVMFVGLVVMGIDRYPKVIAALVGAGTTYLLAGLPNRVGLLIGAFVGIIVASLSERWRL